MSATPHPEQAALRRRMRQARAAVTRSARKHAAHAIASHVARSHWLRPNLRVALFASMADEIDTAPLLRVVAQRRAQIFLPRIVSSRSARMCFTPLGSRWRRNCYGIVEPASNHRQPTIFLDVIFLPLLAFDATGTRLGMGGGYYDRALDYRLRRYTWRGPMVIGLAFDLQEVAVLARQPHDVPLDAIITPRGIRWFSRVRSA
jgi:5-formyltetrahydrofolate cyclo-ligase